MLNKIYQEEFPIVKLKYLDLNCKIVYILYNK